MLLPPAPTTAASARHLSPSPARRRRRPRLASSSSVLPSAPAHRARASSRVTCTTVENLLLRGGALSRRPRRRRRAGAALHSSVVRIPRPSQGLIIGVYVRLRHSAVRPENDHTPASRRVDARPGGRRSAAASCRRSWPGGCLARPTPPPQTPRPADDGDRGSGERAPLATLRSKSCVLSSAARRREGGQEEEGGRSGGLVSLPFGFAAAFLPALPLPAHRPTAR